MYSIFSLVENIADHNNIIIMACLAYPNNHAQTRGSIGVYMLLAIAIELDLVATSLLKNSTTNSVKNCFE